MLQERLGRFQPVMIYFICNPAENVSDEAVEFTVCTTEGHTIRFFYKEDQWMAEATENLPTGFSKVVTLPIDCADGFSIEAIAKSTPEFQKNHVHVNFRPSCSDPKRHVYVGQIGLNGGGGGVSTCASDDFLDIPEAISLTAENQVGSMSWAYNGRRGSFGPNTHKCNLFVAEVLAAVGARAGGIPSSDSGIRQFLERPPLAKEWADGTYISNWEIVNNPQRGDVVAESYNTEEGDGYSGHVGIVVIVSGCGDDGESVSASSYEGGRIVRSAFGFRPHGQPIFRRFTGSRWALIDSISNGNW